MARTIVVALDGSPVAEEAVPVAAHLAGDRDGVLLLLRVVPPPPAQVWEYPMMPLMENPAELEREDREAAEKYLEAVQRTLAGPTRLMVREGMPAAEILAAARQVDAEFIVMTTHGRTGLARMVMGSVADAVVRGSPVPVVLMCPHRIAAEQAAR